MLAYVKAYMVQNEPSAPTGLDGWRRNSAARWEHTRRVLATAQKIARVEGANMDLVSVAAIFHDVAKLNSERDEHAARGAEIAAEYLQREEFPADWIARVDEVIRNHTSSQADVPLEDCVLRDADLLDEVGALGIVWTAMNAGIEAPAYAEARARIAKYDRRTAEKTVQVMSTRAGRALAEQRLAFVNAFIAQLEDECGDLVGE